MLDQLWLLLQYKPLYSLVHFAAYYSWNDTTKI